MRHRLPVWLSAPSAAASHLPVLLLPAVSGNSPALSRQSSVPVMLLPNLINAINLIHLTYLVPRQRSLDVYHLSMPHTAQAFLYMRSVPVLLQVLPLNWVQNVFSFFCHNLLFDFLTAVVSAHFHEALLSLGGAVNRIPGRLRLHAGSVPVCPPARQNNVFPFPRKCFLPVPIALPP